MRPQLRLAATAAALLALSQPAMAQSTGCIAAADLSDAMTYSIPLVVDGLQTSCSDALPADSFLLTKGNDFASQFEPLHEDAWPGARRSLMSFSETGEGKGEMSGVLKNLPDDALRPFVDAMLVELVVQEFKPTTCGDVNRVMPLLAPLPAENYGPLLASLFSFVGGDDGDLKICKD